MPCSYFGITYRMHGPDQKSDCLSQKFVTFAGGSILVIEEAFSIVIGIQGHHEEFNPDESIKNSGDKLPMITDDFISC